MHILYSYALFRLITSQTLVLSCRSAYLRSLGQLWRRGRSGADAALLRGVGVNGFAALGRGQVVEKLPEVGG